MLKRSMMDLLVNFLKELINIFKKTKAKDQSQIEVPQKYNPKIKSYVIAVAKAGPFLHKEENFCISNKVKTG